MRFPITWLFVLVAVIAIWSMLAVWCHKGPPPIPSGRTEPMGPIEHWAFSYFMAFMLPLLILSIPTMLVCMLVGMVKVADFLVKAIK